MYDVYILGKDALILAASGLTRGGAARKVDALMAASKSDARPTVAVYRAGRYVYTRKV